MATTGFGCDVATRVTGTIDFTIQPSGRVVRRDRVTVSAGVAACAGCADTDGNPPIFTSYLTFSPELERYQVEPAVTSTVFPVAGTAADLPAPSAPVVGCVSGATAASPSVGLAWRFPTPSAGMRARTTGDTRVNHAMVVDWVNGGALAAGTYELITALAVEREGVVDCSVALRTAMAEFARPPTLTPTSFVAERGTYRYTGDEGVGIMITADQGVAGGAVLEVPNASERGVTVWRGSGAAFTRLRRGQDYLLQLEADRTAVIYLPALVVGTAIVVSGPGGDWVTARADGSLLLEIAHGATRAAHYDELRARLDAPRRIDHDVAAAPAAETAPGLAKALLRFWMNRRDLLSSQRCRQSSPYPVFPRPTIRASRRSRPSIWTFAVARFSPCWGPTALERRH